MVENSWSVDVRIRPLEALPFCVEIKSRTSFRPLRKPTTLTLSDLEGEAPELILPNGCDLLRFRELANNVRKKAPSTGLRAIRSRRSAADIVSSHCLKSRASAARGAAARSWVGQLPSSVLTLYLRAFAPRGDCNEDCSMTKRHLSRFAALLAVVMLATACSQPIEIVGEGDVVSQSGNRDCSLIDFRAGATNCTDNLITGAYDETYYGVAAADWHFHRWAGVCMEAIANECSFDVSADGIDQLTGISASPITAIFRPDVVTGYESLFIGHSFFRPFAQEMAFHGPSAGFTDHNQSIVFSGGAGGAPEALWNNASKRAQIQGHLDDGDIDLFGMTYHPTYPTLSGYISWIDYALAQNPDTRFFVALPWGTNPGSTDAATYLAWWKTAHVSLFHGMIDNLRDLYPGIDIYGIPYGQAAGELYSLYDAGQLPDVDTLVSGSGDAIFSDTFGHPDDILEDLGELIWLRAIYDVDLSTYAYDPGYTTDLKAIADAIMDEHDTAYDAP